MASNWRCNPKATQMLAPSEEASRNSKSAGTSSLSGFQASRNSVSRGRMRNTTMKRFLSFAATTFAASASVFVDFVTLLLSNTTSNPIAVELRTKPRANVCALRTWGSQCIVINCDMSTECTKGGSKYKYTNLCLTCMRTCEMARSQLLL